MERHKARLNAEFAKARLRRGCSSVEELRAQVKASKEVKSVTDSISSADMGKSRAWAYPRWVRVNVLNTTLEDQIKTTFAAYEEIMTLKDLLQSTESSVFYVDKNIPNLIAIPPSQDLTKSPAYLRGAIILQDKASCFPAYLLDPKSSGGDCIDACAAPGNKTTHLAAVLHGCMGVKARPMIHACERDKSRAVSLVQMVQTAGAESQVNVHAGQDFLKTDASQSPWNNVTSLLLDPSCSGSGIVGRDEVLQVTLPRRNAHEDLRTSKKRKRRGPQGPLPTTTTIPEEIPMDDPPSNQLASRLDALSAFQLRLLLHAFKFSKARKITYSTCSLYAEENEQVVIKALLSDIAQERGWRILQRQEQVEGLRSWQIRGNEEACKDCMSQDVGFDTDMVAEACIRCERGTKEGTQGFFVAAFIRDENMHNEQDYHDEWDGFNDVD